MRIAVIGTGYVGLVSGTCFSEFGHSVICVDKDEGKIANLLQGQIPIYEPSLDDLVVRNMEAGRLKFTTNLAQAVQQADAVFIAVGTPSRRGDGHADLSYVYSAVEEIADYINGYTVIINKSTVPVGTGREVESRIQKQNPSADFDVVSNPEFLREGAAIDDFMRPDRIVVGTSSEKAQELMKELYRPLYLNNTPILFTTLETAELIKYASNAFLATKISFINEIADLCEKTGADIQDVSHGMGLDGRIGTKFLNAGPGYGGSCFPKDTLALLRIATEAGVESRIVSAVVEANDTRKLAMAEKVIAACGGSVANKKISILGLTFKPNTDDIRYSPALDIIPALQSAGATISAYDPEGMEEAKKCLENITYCEDAYDTMQGSDAVVIITEWNQFRALNFNRMKELMKETILVDLRNVYGRDNIIPDFVTYFGVGK